jgi:bacterioferritin (cytochrome b1)
MKSLSGEIASEGQSQALNDASDTSDSDEFWDSLREEESHCAELDDWLNDITHIITSL